MNLDKSNILFQIAADLVNQSSSNIFLTGKAGTGKTTFLKYIREHCSKQMAVVAPTGVAAINAGGVTIHSFFQLPFAPFVPEKHGVEKNEEVVSRSGLITRLRLTGEKLKVLRQLELLIIDEVSMVRCDTMDAIDTVLRHVRKRPAERFGGVQVLFIGDMFQLPPVIKDAEWKFLAEHYNSPYFFDSLVIREQPPVYIEFDRIYRQSEEIFIRLLNQVRNNEMDEEGMAILEKRFQPAFHREKNDGYIVLTTHNERARDINNRELNNLLEKTVSFKAEINDDFPNNAFPADEVLNLKKGAQVMFIKNDSDRTKRYFNGKIGVVTKFEKEKIYVLCKDEEDEIEVGPETWKNIRYTVNKTNREVDEEELGSFVQYPLRLAWAITIHKSQGLTFEKAIIDAGEAFAAGQVYVALSRCTSLNGMVLQSRIKRGSLYTDDKIIRFSKSCNSPQQLQDELAIGKRNYQARLLINIFDVASALGMLEECSDYLTDHESSFNPESIPWIDQCLLVLQQIQVTAIKFKNWLQAQFNQPVLPEENTVLQTKIRDGAAHFIKEIQSAVTILQQSPVQTDSRIHAKEFNETIKEVLADFSLKSYLMKSLDQRFDADAWHKSKKSFVAPYFNINAYAGSSDQKTTSEHPQLYQQLKKLRDSICSKKDIPIYMVAGSKSLEEMVSYLPQSADELEEISGFGKSRIESYGQQFLDIIMAYCEDHNLSSRIASKEPKGKKGTAKKQLKESGQLKESKQGGKTKVDTKAESLRLFKGGLPPRDIAQTRKLTQQTIEGHLAYFVERGEIAIEELVSKDKLELIEPAIKDFDGGSIMVIKEKLGNAVGFGEIRLAIAWRRFIKSTEQAGEAGTD